MKHKKCNHIQRAVRAAALLLCYLVAPPASAQDISEIGKSDPLIITGAVGTSNTYYHSTSAYGSASPLSNSVYANLNVSLYGFSMPFSLYYTNDNLDFNYPHISFNLTPRYKNWTGHIGRSSIAFSNYVMNMGFNGVGLEYNDKNWRVGAFYGTLRKAINDNPLDPSARTPQYKRVGWGFKVGYGSNTNFVDLYLLRVHDQLKSVDEQWRQHITPQENLVVGLRGTVTPTRFLSFTANIATSAFTLDTQSEKVSAGDVTRWDKVFEAKESTLLRFAGDFTANISVGGVNTSVFYRIIQPDYQSLGTYYMSNNYHSLGITANTTLFKRLSLSGSFSGQEDNLTNKQLYTTRGFIYNASASTRIGHNLNLMVGYNGYLQTQGDGTMVVKDSTRVKRLLHSFTFMPTYMIDSELLTHSFSISASYTQNKDLNKFATGVSDVNTLSVGMNYGVDVKPWEVDFTTSFSHQQSDGYRARYTSDIASLTASRSFLKERNLSASLTGSICYNEVKNTSKNLSLGADASVNYTLAKVHVFSVSGSLNKYGDVNMSKRRSNLDDLDFNASFNYTYTFSLLEIKRKEKPATK